MTTGRQQPSYQFSPLAHTLPSQDQLDSDLDSEQDANFTLDRMHIHIDMTDSHYLEPSTHHQDSLRSVGLPGTCSGENTSLLAYPQHDLVPYSAVSSFNYPATADPTLLTPVSSAGSPPLQQRQSTKGLQYTSQAVSGPQQPTPPSTSGMYYSSYDMNASSQSPSPLTVHPHATESSFDMVGNYIGPSPHPSPKNEIPPPIHQYLGHYSVSGRMNEPEVPGSFSQYPDFTDVDPGFLARGHPQMPMNAPHPHMVVTSAGAQAPILAQPHPSHLRAQTALRPGGIEDLRDIEIMTHGLPGPDGFPSRVSLSPARKPQRKQKTQQRRNPRAASRQQSHVQLADAQSAGQNHEDEAESSPLRLDDKAPAEDKFLFELRQKYIGEKGKGMWEDISREYCAKYQTMEKAALQMKVSRAVAKYGEWPDKEVNALLEAYRYDEESRYERLLERMKKFGGARAWDWKPQHLEAKLVALGLEEPNIDERSHSRRRKRAAQRRRASSQNQQSPAVIGDWNNGLGMHQPVVHPSQGYPMGPHPVAYDVANHQAYMGPSLTPEQNEKIIDDIFNGSIKTEPDGTLTPDAMETVYEGNEGGANTRSKEGNFDHSQQVALQVCELVRPQSHR